MKHKLFIILISLSISISIFPARNIQHPQLMCSNVEKEIVQSKIKTQSWASAAFENIKKEVDVYVDKHQTDPEWIISRMAMYWKAGEHYTQCYLKNENWNRGEGNAPVPTVRMPGMRTWNKYKNVPLEDRRPYNESGDMLAMNVTDSNLKPVLVPYKESGHLVRNNNVEILTLAENAAFVYWVNGEDKYARFAADIFNTWLNGTYYMNPILDLDKSSGGYGGWQPGGNCGYYDYEQIHDDLAYHAAPVYDFLFDYLKMHPSTHLKQINKPLEEVVGVVFKRFIDLGMIRGGKVGNWNVNGWNMILRPIMVLESNDYYTDGKGKEYYLQYLTTKSTQYHDAIPDIVKNYSPVTGLWPESPGYAFGTISMLLDFATILQKSGVDIIAANPVLQKAAMAAFPWMDEQGNMVVFGDSRGGTVNFVNFDKLLAYYTQKKDSTNIKVVASALKSAVYSDKYKREKADWTGICLFTDSIPSFESVGSVRTVYSAKHRHVVMKNFEGDKKLMATLYGGTKGSHLTPNGLALQLYGYGYALAPDASGYESYWSKDVIYHQSPTGANTILPGYSEGPIRIEAIEPAVDSSTFTNKQELNPNIGFSDISAAGKRRLVALVKTSSTGGYYVDIFRSKQMENDYLYHNLGNKVELLTNQNEKLETKSISDIGKKWHEGYNYFKNIRKVDCGKDFIAKWETNLVTPSISMKMWMKGVKGRELFLIDAPYSSLNPLLTPGGVCTPPQTTPTLLVRQNGVDGWVNPYVAVFEPIKGDNSGVISVHDFYSAGNFVGICVNSVNNRIDYILDAVDSNVYNLRNGFSFRGTFGMVSEKNGETISLYLGNGTKIAKGKLTISADKNVYASVYQMNGRWYYSASDEVVITIDKWKQKLPAGYKMSLKF